MIEAAEAMLTAHGVDEQRIFIDKFTTDRRGGRAAADGATVKRVAGRPGERVRARAFTWYAPRRRRATLYEDVTIDTQPSIHRHLRADGR